MKRRIKIKIDPKGNVTAETIAGFAGNSCNKTLDNIFVSINGQMTDSGDADGGAPPMDPLAYVVGEGR